MYEKTLTLELLAGKLTCANKVSLLHRLPSTHRLLTV